MRCIIRIDGKCKEKRPDNLSRWLWQHDGDEAVVIDDATKSYFCGRAEMVTAYREAWESERKVGDKRRAAMFMDLDRVLFAKETPLMPNQSPAWCKSGGCACSEIFECSGACL